MSTQRDAPWLLPNLGAEEGPGWERMLRAPRVATAAWLFGQLFPADVRLPPEYFGQSSEDGPTDGALEARRAAFGWLEERRGCIAWLADADARQRAASAGSSFEGPAPDVVADVNDKAFALAEAEAAGFVPRSLRGTSVAFEPDALTDADEAHARITAAVASWPAFAREAFTLKPRHGTSGRGRLDVEGALDAGALRSALPGLASRGGAILEPWLEREVDLSAQLHLAAAGDSQAGGVVLLGTLEQRVSRRGTFLGHRGEIDSRGRVFSGLPDDEDLREAAAAVAGAALRRGYTGPCGVDGFVFRWQDESGEWRRTLRPVVELNGRFTMGTVTLGLVRRHTDRIREAQGLRPGDRRAFDLQLDAPRGGWEAACERAGSGAFVAPLDGPGALRPGILFARSRADLARALDAPAEGGEDRSTEPPA